MPNTKTTKPTAKATKPAVKKTPVEAKAQTSLTIEVLDMTGKVTETMTLPEAVFAAKINRPLVAQAVRVYLANQRSGTASTKTRGEVTGSTKKIYRQKGTGNARHGGKRAPIFVHGGIAHGPKPRDYSMSLSQKMRRAALNSALTEKLQQGAIKVVVGLEALEPKTKAFAAVAKSLALADSGKRVLLVTASAPETMVRAVRNFADVSYLDVKQLNTYEVMKNAQIIMMKDAITALAGGESK